MTEAFIELFKVIVGAVAAAAPVARTPEEVGGVVGPKPVPHRMMTSPGFAATVPGIVAGLATSALSG